MRMDQHIKRLIEKYTIEASRLSGHGAIEKYSMAYAQAKELGNAFTLRACAANLGAAYVSLGKKEEAEKGIEHLKESIPPAGIVDCVSNGDLFFNIALGYEVAGRYREAGSYFEDALKEYKGERDNLNMEIDTLKRLVQNSLLRKRTAEMVKWYKELEETYRRANKLTDQLLVMVQRIANQQRLVGQSFKQKTPGPEAGMESTGEENGGEEDGEQREINGAVEQCCNMLENVRREGKITVGILVQVSVLLTQFKELEKARQLLEDALSLFEVEDGRSVEQAVVLQNLGTICNYLNDWERAIPYHQRAAAIYQYYASRPADPKLPIQPHAAQRCQGHCLAGHAFAFVHLEDVDEARVFFDKAREMAERSGDFDTKWQMDEALGAVHFRMATKDIMLPSPLTEDTRLKLPESSLDHLEKSMRWYKKALEDLASGPRGTSHVQDRVLEKYTLVQSLRKNASKAAVIPFTQPPVAPAVAQPVSVEKTAAKTESEDSGSTEEEGDDDEDDDDDDGSSSNDSKGLGKTVRTPAEDDGDEEAEQMKALYKEQLGIETLQRSGAQQRVGADVHSQRKHHSSSAESGSTDSASDCSDDDESEEESERRRAPPVPSLSPPRTLQASGTYENPQNPEMQINELYGTPSRPRPRVTKPTDYAELDFERKQQAGGSQDPDYEPVEVKGQAAQKSAAPSTKEDQRIGFAMGDSYLSHGDEKKDAKESKTCAVM
ncbi:tetratricopeptide repeat protein 24-like isoform X2 [Littorina saxatilis]|uniref:Uncharacterized protein n=1 Tax=Littorina saxatilis TaxID=31220 RepID=A0AAN9C927_9CAEN